MAGTIDRSTKINLGSAAAILLALLGGLLWLTSEIRDVCDEVHAVRLELAGDRLGVAVLGQRVKALEEKKEASK